MSPAFPLNHAHLLLRRLLSQNPNTGPAQHYVVLMGEKTASRNDTDRELPFRQESNFAWLTGCDVPGSALTVSYTHEGGSGEFDPESVKTQLFLPEVDPDEVMWCGLPPTPADLQKTLSFTSISSGWTPITLFPKPSSLPTIIHHLPWTSPPTSKVASINGPKATSQYLLPALHAARRNKTSYEIELMKKAADITSASHQKLMEAFGKGECKDENEAEAIFVAESRRRGGKWQAYTPIMASGTSAGTLHYITNESEFPKEGLLLVDAGAEFKCYAGDVTRCIPIGNGGKFNKECREIYELVLSMQEAAFAMIKPGANWESIQLKMHSVVTLGLLKLGIFIPGSLKGSDEEVAEGIIKTGLSNAFFPHGVGHLLGLDVHDVGGLPEGKSKDPLLKYLRLRVPLEEGFVVTVEPGCYFNEFLFKPHENSPHIDKKILDKYWAVGGVRIEDNVLVTKDGFENFTTAPKTVAEVEALTATA